MVEFYNHYILPSSPARAKLAIHLTAQSNGPVVATPAVAEKTIKNATTIIEKGISALGLDKSSIQDKIVSNMNSDVEKDSNGTMPVVITDVRAFKASLQVSAGPTAVRDLIDFEDLDAKL